MILNKLELKNFKKYKEKTIEFATGLVGIIGKNGSGKSTIFEAILFVLFGVFKSKDVIKNSYASTKDIVSVVLEFEIDTDTFIVHREFRGKDMASSAKLYKNGNLLSTGIKEVTNSIKKIVKMDKTAFLHTLFASQKELSSLSALKLEDRKKMIRKLLGLEKIDNIQDKLIEKTKEIKKEIEAYKDILLSEDKIIQINNEIDANQSNINLFENIIKTNITIQNDLNIKVQSLKQNIEQMQKIKEQKIYLTNQKEILNSKLISNNDNLSILQNEYNSLEEKQQEIKSIEYINQEYEQLQINIKECQNIKEINIKKDGLKKEKDLLEAQYRKIRDDIKIINNEIQIEETISIKYNQTISKYDELLVQIAQIDDKINNIKSNINSEQNIINMTIGQINNLQNIGKNSKCPTCTRPLLEEYDNVIQSLSKTISSIQTQKIDTYKINLQNIQQHKIAKDSEKKSIEYELQSLSNQLAIINTKKKTFENLQNELLAIANQGKNIAQQIQSISHFVYDENIHNCLIQKEATIKDIYNKYKELNTVLKNLPKTIEKINMTKDTIKSLSSQITAIETQIKAYIYDELAHTSTISQYEAHMIEEKNITTIINNAKIDVASIKAKLDILSNTISQNMQIQSKVSHKIEDLNDYEKIKVSLSEFKTKLNAKIAPRISQLASTMYAQITKGKYQHIEVNNDFDFFIYDDGTKYPIDRYSGGEIDLANLVLRISISKTLSELNGTTNIGFLAFDEVFGSQDETRRVEILQAFHTIKEQYRQIFLISHEAEIKEMFENIIEV